MTYLVWSAVDALLDVTIRSLTRVRDALEAMSSMTGPTQARDSVFVDPARR